MLFKKILDDLLPQCENCSASSIELFCKKCEESLLFKNACSFCGKENLNIAGNACLPCSSTKFPVQSIQIEYFYRDGIQLWMKDIKDHHKLERLKELSFERFKEIKNNYESIVPITGCPKNRKKRGFELSFEIAKKVSRESGIPVERSLFRRTPFFSSIRNMDLHLRKKVISKTISLRKEPPFLGRVLLVDDVLTTGASLFHHAELIKPYASQIDAYVVARVSKA